MKELVHHDMSVGLPSGWDDSSTVVLVGPERDDFTPNITITRDALDQPMTAQAYAESQRSSLQEEFGPSGYSILHEGPIAIGGLTAYQRRHTFNIPEADVPIQQLQIYAVKDGVAITITATDRVEHFEQSRPMFMQAIQTFKFLQ